MKTDKDQIADQCKAVAHMAQTIADIHLNYEKVFRGKLEPRHAMNVIGLRTAALMETLGNVLNGMDAATDEDDWLAPIFKEAQKRYPQS